MKKLIKVTQRHIKDGLRENAFSCPVARAVQNSYGFDRVGVAADYVYIDKGDGSHRQINGIWPRSVVRFINRFDAGKPVKPFNFYIDI